MNALCRAEGPVACAHACFGDTDRASLVEELPELEVTLDLDHGADHCYANFDLVHGDDVGSCRWGEDDPGEGRGHRSYVASGAPAATAART